MQTLVVVLVPFLLALGVAGCGSDPNEPVELSVVSISPASDATEVEPRATIRVELSAALEADTVTPARFTVTAGGAAIAGVLQVDGAVISFVPDAPYGASTDVAVAIAAGIESRAGAPLANPVESGFRTRDAAWANAWKDPISDPHDEGFRLAANARGEAAVLWKHEDILWANRLAGDGTWRGSTRISDPEPSRASEEAVAIDDAGTVTATWVDVDRPATKRLSRVLVARAPAGGAWQTAQTLASGESIAAGAGSELWGTRLGVEARSGIGYVLWSDSLLTDDGQLIRDRTLVRRFTRDGSQLGTATVNDEGRLVVFGNAMSGEGGFGAVWVAQTDDGAYSSSVFADASGALGPARELVDPKTARTTWSIALAMSGDRAIALGFGGDELGNTYLLDARVLDGVGGTAPWGEPRRLASAFRIETGTLKVSRSGQYFAAWRSMAGTKQPYHLFVARYVPDGGGWQAAEEVDAPAGDETFYYDLAIDDRGAALLVFSQGVGGTPGLYYNRFSPGTGWSGPAKVPTGPTVDGPVAVAAYGRGGFIAAWSEAGRVHADRFE